MSLTVVLAAIGFFGAPAFGRGLPAVREQPTPADLSRLVRFSDALAYVAETDHCAIVAEAWPLYDALSPTDLQTLREHLRDAAAPGDRLKWVAEAFDYKMTRNEYGVYLLEKRYRDIADVPFVTPGEALTDYESIRARMKDLSGADIGATTGSHQRDLQRRLGALLTPEQRDRMAAGLKIGELSPEQRDIVWDAVYTPYIFGPVTGLREPIDYLRGILSPNARFQYFETPAWALRYLVMRP